MSDPKKQRGEGDYDAARRYRDRVEEHIEDEGVNPSSPVQSPGSDRSEEEKARARARNESTGADKD